MHKKFYSRLSFIQHQLGVSPTGVLDLTTLQTILSYYKLQPTSISISDCIKLLQSFLDIRTDGILGSQTLTAIEKSLSLPILDSYTVDNSLIISKKTFDFIIQSEISSESVYNSKYQKPIWPGGYSGITIGIGYDCGYSTKKDIIKTWINHIPSINMSAILDTSGIKGKRCKLLLPALANISIPYEIAVRKFHNTVLPACARDVRKTYPGVEKLPPDTQGAILSLIYNRGYLINGTDRRKEMKALKPIIAAGNLQGIAQQLRNMKRLWDPKKQKGLIVRREQEALLAENGSYNILPEQLIIV